MQRQRSTDDATTTTRLRETLRRGDFFAQLPDAALDELIGMIEPVALEEGATLIAEGDEAENAFVILTGEVEILRRSGEIDVPIGVRGAGEIVGEMGMLSGSGRTATVRARVPSTVLPISREVFERTLVANPTAMLALLRTVIRRLQGAESRLVQHQKMAALGTLAAGLAHELNNPASALVRSVQQLHDIIGEWERRAGDLGASGLHGDMLPILAALQQDIESHAGDAVWLDAVTRSDREEAVQEWLDERHIAESWKLAPQLVDVGWDLELLGQLQDFVPTDRLPAVLRWLAAGQSVYRLLHEMTASARTISEIVAAVKSYTRLDEAPVQEVDIHEGIDQSLTILRYKLRGIKVSREYDCCVPPIMALASELNQVWTNLIDNAADAMDGEGHLRIRTALERGTVVVEFSDTGPGIPPGAQARLFEPFFTTKEPGKGTGLGLNISYNIVRKHHGEITVDSRPGQTRFVVSIPVGEAAREPDGAAGHDGCPA